MGSGEIGIKGNEITVNVVKVAVGDHFLFFCLVYNYFGEHRTINIGNGGQYCVFFQSVCNKIKTNEIKKYRLKYIF